MLSQSLKASPDLDPRVGQLGLCLYHICHCSALIVGVGPGSCVLPESYHTSFSPFLYYPCSVRIAKLKLREPPVEKCCSHRPVCSFTWALLVHSTCWAGLPITANDELLCALSFFLVWFFPGCLFCGFPTTVPDPEMNYSWETSEEKAKPNQATK